MKQTFSFHRAAFGAGIVADIHEHPTPTMFHRFEGRTDAVHKEAENWQAKRKSLLQAAGTYHRQRSGAAESGLERRNQHPLAGQNGAGRTQETDV
jgi:hypothetical protein